MSASYAVYKLARGMSSIEYYAFWSWKLLLVFYSIRLYTYGRSGRPPGRESKHQPKLFAKVHGSRCRLRGLFSRIPRL